MSDEDAMKFVIDKLLYGNIVCSDLTIPLKMNYPPGKHKDVITLNKPTGGTTGDPAYKDEYYPLSEDNPYYDPSNPDEVYPQVTRKSKTAEKQLDIHIWSNEENKRECIVNQVTTILEDALRFNYKYCANFSETNGNICLFTNNVCDALTTVNKYSIQGKCPYADLTESDELFRNPRTWFEEKNIPIFSIEISDAVQADDLTKTPELYHSIISIRYQLEIIMEVDVLPLCEIETTDTEIMETNPLNDLNKKTK